MNLNGDVWSMKRRGSAYSNAVKTPSFTAPGDETCSRLPVTIAIGSDMKGLQHRGSGNGRSSVEDKGVQTETVPGGSELLNKWRQGALAGFRQMCELAEKVWAGKVSWGGRKESWRETGGFAARLLQRMKSENGGYFAAGRLHPCSFLSFNNGGWLVFRDLHASVSHIVHRGSLYLGLVVRSWRRVMVWFLLSKHNAQKDINVPCAKAEPEVQICRFTVW